MTGTIEVAELVAFICARMNYPLIKQRGLFLDGRAPVAMNTKPAYQQA